MLCRGVIPFFVKLQPEVMMWVKGSSMWLVDNPQTRVY